MSRSDVKDVFGNTEQPGETGAIAVLVYFELLFLRMIHGVGLFFWQRVPNFFRLLFEWLRKAAWAFFRIAVRLVRVMIAASIWAAIVFLPLTAYPGMISGTYTILALTGSYIGLRRHLKKQATFAQPGASHVELLHALVKGY